MPNVCPGRSLLCVLIAAALQLSAANAAFGQQLDWVRYADTSAGTITGWRVAVDAAGNSHVVGNLHSTVTLGVGEPNQTTLTAGGAINVFVARYDPDGQLLWAKSAGGPNNVQSIAIDIDAAGNSYIAGYFQIGATFDGGAVTLVDAGQVDIFIAKYDVNGNFVWAKRAGGTFSDFGRGIATDAAGNSYVTGSFSSINGTFGQGEPNQTTLSRAGSSDIFLAKYDTNGMLVWARRAGGTGADSANSVAIDAAGYSYVTGTFGNAFGSPTTATFGPGEPNSTTLTASSNRGDLFIAHYDPNGALVWAKRAGGTGNAEAVGSDIAVDASGFTYLTGFFSLNTTFGPGEPNQTTLPGVGSGLEMFVASFDTGGALRWARRALGNAGIISQEDRGEGIAVDGAGRSVVTGRFTQAITFGPGEPNQTVLTATAGLMDTDIFIAGYEADGSLRWARRAGGSDRGDEGHGVALDAAGRQYVIGSFNGTATFGPGEPNQVTITTPGGNTFLARFEEPDITPPAIACDAPDGLWHAADVSIACTASDSGSGLANSGDASFSLVTNVAAGIETSNASTDSRVVCDVAGNCATAGPIAGNMIDKKAPVIVITTPVDSVVYQIGQSVIAAYSCVDGGSGTASCTGTAANGGAVDTATLGIKTFTVNAADHVGNVSSQSVTYDVRRTLSAVQSATLWTGYPSLLSVGLRLDLRADLLLDGVVVASGTLDNVPAGTGLGLGGFNDAVLRTVTMSLTSGAVDVPAGATLSLRASARRSCTGGGGLAASARFWFDGQPVDTGTGRDAGSRVLITLAGVTSDYFARDLFTLSATAGTSRQSVDATLSGAACPARPFVPFGTWNAAF